MKDNDSIVNYEQIKTSDSYLDLTQELEYLKQSESAIGDSSRKESSKKESSKKTIYVKKSKNQGNNRNRTTFNHDSWYIKKWKWIWRVPESRRRKKV